MAVYANARVRVDPRPCVDVVLEFKHMGDRFVPMRRHASELCVHAHASHKHVSTALHVNQLILPYFFSAGDCCVLLHCAARQQALDSHAQPVSVHESRRMQQWKTL
jgi:hypothetical protein